MSYFSYFEIGCDGLSVRRITIVESFISLGWSLSADGDQASAIEIVSEMDKVDKRLEFGVRWANPATTVGLGISAFNQVSGCVENSGRIVIPGAGRITDYTWYTERLIKPLVACGIKISSMKWIDTD